MKTYRELKRELNEGLSASSDGKMNKSFEAVHKAAGKEPHDSGSTAHRAHAQYKYKNAAEAKEHLAKIHSHLSSVHKHVESHDDFHSYKSAHTTGHVTAMRQGSSVLVMHDHHNMEMKK